MSNQPALAVLRDELGQRTVELDAAIRKLKATPRDAERYGAAYGAKWAANEAYIKAWDAWYEESEKPPAGATAEGDETKPIPKERSDFNV